MNRRQRILGSIALCGWLAAAGLHARSAFAGDGVDRSRLTLRRNQCLLVSSVCMNTLVASWLYGYAKRSLRGT